MAKKAYPLRINEEVLNAVQGWANEELRSVNAQIEYVLREALRKSGRSKNRTLNRLYYPKNRFSPLNL